MTLLWIIIGIIVIAGGVWYIKKSKNKPQPPQNPQPSQRPQPPQNPQPPQGPSSYSGGTPGM